MDWGDYDWFISTTGNDRFDGGNGKDMVSYIEWQNDARNVAVTFSRDGAPPDSSVVTGVVVDLANVGNNTHLAAGDTYVSIERITGSSRQDVFYGDGNSNDFRGLGITTGSWDRPAVVSATTAGTDSTP